MSDKRDAADGAASDGGATEDGSDSGGRTAVVTKSVVRPQRPTGKRSRQRAVAADEDAEDTESSTATEVSKKGSKKDTKSAEKSAKTSAKKSVKAKKTTKAGRPAARSANPFIFVYNYMKQVVAEMRKVIWPNRRQMITYTSVVLVFLAFMVALVGGADLGLGRLVMLVFG
ncbi:preprotein translocase subunit SecE [Mycobacterium ostraviense]|uniref:Protein translocase subunit SecE n=1 Tax=Mycobacterium ostraviense TaxID=2738409 RepID=A0A163UZ02_9MYCO|nr:preprotein translocase subunit SecE [Mycobacterium ostraviense]KZS56808.1 preprotein translocase subunit SecE [Mycobacterium ostraviense]UGT90690.1 preprotein translocase subunit SecE [Mycobacterium ostraviense]